MRAKADRGATGSALPGQAGHGTPAAVVLPFSLRHAAVTVTTLILVVVPVLPELAVGRFGLSTLWLGELLVLFILSLWLGWRLAVQGPHGAWMVKPGLELVLLVLAVASVGLNLVASRRLGNLAAFGNELMAEHFHPLYTKPGVLPLFPAQVSVTAVFYLLHLAEFVLLYYVGRSVGKRVGPSSVYQTVLLGLGVQLAVALAQTMASGAPVLSGVRQAVYPSGTFLVSETLGSYVLVCMSLGLARRDRASRVVLVLVSAVVLLLSGNRSGIVAFVALGCLWCVRRWRSAMSVAFLAPVGLVCLFFSPGARSLAVDLTQRLTSPYTLIMRFRLWHDVFEPLAWRAPLLGLAFPNVFTDSVFWFFVISLGFPSLVVVIVFLRLHWNRSLLQFGALSWPVQGLVFSFMVQGLAYNGYTYTHAGFGWWFALGIAVSWLAGPGMGHVRGTKLGPALASMHR